MKLDKLTSFLDNYLKIADFPGDVSNNGLQVSGKDEVKCAVFGVDACQMLFDRAAELDADFIFVHHGLSWGAFPKRLTGIESARFGTLFRERMSLYAAHLPLDAHKVSGNNIQIAKMLNLKNIEDFCIYSGYFIGCAGNLAKATEAALIAEKCHKLFPDAEISLLGSAAVKKIAIVSGGGGMDAVVQAHASGADMLITGELTHTMYHPALEYNIPVVSLGHYASETTGPKAMMDVVATEFGIDCHFIDIPTGL